MPAAAWKSVGVGLDRLARSWCPGFGDQDREDAVSLAIERFLEVAKGGRIDAGTSPVPFFVTVTRNRVIDHARSLRWSDPVADLEIQADETDATEDLVVALASEATINELMTRAKDAGDDRVNDVIRVWRSMSEREDRDVSIREVANELGWHHEEVRRALRRARSYLLGPVE